MYPDGKNVVVSYLERHKSRTDTIPYEKMITMYDKADTVMKFGGWIKAKHFIGSRTLN